MGNPTDVQAPRRAYRRAMDMYVILRRAAWTTLDEVAAANERSLAVGAEMEDDVRWIRSYITADVGETLRALCVYQAVSPEALREHASEAGMRADEIVAIRQTVVIRPDPLASVPATLPELGEPRHRA